MQPQITQQLHQVHTRTMPKVLIFHGFGSSPKICHSQTPNLRTSLESEGLTVEYPHGPVILKPEDFPIEDVHDCTKQNLYCWWHLKPPISTGPLFELFKERYYNDEVIGAIGISQGGSLTTVLNANYLELLPSLKFTVGFSAYLYPDPDWTETDWSVYQKGIRLPCLSVIGNDDLVVEPKVSKKIEQEAINDYQEIEHEYGHVFADEDIDVVNRVVEWILNYI